MLGGLLCKPKNIWDYNSHYRSFKSKRHTTSKEITTRSLGNLQVHAHPPIFLKKIDQKRTTMVI